MEEKTKRPRLHWRTAAMAVCLAVFVVSATLLVRDLLQANKEEDANRLLAEQVHKARSAPRIPAPIVEDREIKDEPAPEPEPPKYAESGLLLQYDALWQQNADMAGWLCIDGIGVDYPVMFTPDDPEYYLHRGFDKKYAASGCLFIGAGCQPDASHVIVYGHNMKNGTMFGDLDQYANAAYAAEHPYLYFDTLTVEGTYEVLSAFYTKIYAIDVPNVFRYYDYTDLSQPEAFNEFTAWAKKSALYDTGVEAAFGDSLLTLSTCSYQTTNGRFVVIARKCAGTAPL